MRPKKKLNFICLFVCLFVAFYVCLFVSVERRKFNVGWAVGGPEATCWIIGMPSQLKSLPPTSQFKFFPSQKSSRLFMTKTFLRWKSHSCVFCGILWLCSSVHCTALVDGGAQISLIPLYLMLFYFAYRATKLPNERIVRWWCWWWWWWWW